MMTASHYDLLGETYYIILMLVARHRMTSDICSEVRDHEDSDAVKHMSGCCLHPYKAIRIKDNFQKFHNGG